MRTDPIVDFLRWVFGSGIAHGPATILGEMRRAESGFVAHPACARGSGAHKRAAPVLGAALSARALGLPSVLFRRNFRARRPASRYATLCTTALSAATRGCSSSRARSLGGVDVTSPP